MRAGHSAVRALNIQLTRGEIVRPFGSGWLISSKGGFEPCPWSYDLAEFCPIDSTDSLLDLGCGAGPLLIALNQAAVEFKRIIGVEIDQKRAFQAKRNMALNGLHNGHIVRGDVRDICLNTRFDLIVANPPFYPVGWGRQSRNPGVAIATHALKGGIAAFAHGAARLLSTHGTAVFIYDGSRMSDALLAITAAGLTVERMRFLDDDRGRPARVLLQASHMGPGLVVDRRRAKNVPEQ